MLLGTKHFWDKLKAWKIWWVTSVCTLWESYAFMIWFICFLLMYKHSFPWLVTLWSGYVNDCILQIAKWFTYGDLQNISSWCYLWYSWGCSRRCMKQMPMILLFLWSFLFPFSIINSFWCVIIILGQNKQTLCRIFKLDC